jgi:hypothetical protein
MFYQLSSLHSYSFSHYHIINLHVLKKIFIKAIHYDTSTVSINIAVILMLVKTGSSIYHDFAIATSMMFIWGYIKTGQLLTITLMT